MKSRVVMCTAGEVRTYKVQVKLHWWTIFWRYLPKKCLFSIDGIIDPNPLSSYPAEFNSEVAAEQYADRVFADLKTARVRTTYLKPRSHE